MWQPHPHIHHCGSRQSCRDITRSAWRSLLEITPSPTATWRQYHLIPHAISWPSQGNGALQSAPLWKGVAPAHLRCAPADTGFGPQKPDSGAQPIPRKRSSYAPAAKRRSREKGLHGRTKAATANCSCGESDRHGGCQVSRTSYYKWPRSGCGHSLRVMPGQHGLGELCLAPFRTGRCKHVRWNNRLPVAVSSRRTLPSRRGPPAHRPALWARVLGRWGRS